MALSKLARIATSRDARVTRSVFTFVLLSTTMLTPVAAPFQPAFAQGAGQTQARSFSIPAQPLSSALSAFITASGWQVGYSSSIASGVTAQGVSGTMSPEQALRTLLSGTGISVRMTGANTATLVQESAGAEGATVDGAIALDTIDVSGGAGTSTSVYTPYETPGAAAHISSQTIERFRGTSPADIFRGTPGVMSGESRNSGGLDVNIRGMQGMGRVATTIDGAENAVSIYQGYQGASNRTFVDPDFISSIDINKGSDVASRGIAGTVTMRTVDADDIVKPGETWGMRVKGSFGTNTSSPEAGALSGYAYPSRPGRPLVESPDGMDRPSILQPTNGAASILAATKGDNVDLVVGYAHRKQGNYHAGKNGPAAEAINAGPSDICNTNGICEHWPQYFYNPGISSYRAGEEVLNTELETRSWLGKATIRLNDEHTLQLGYTAYRGEAGDRMASQLTSKLTQSTQQSQTAGTSLDTGTLRYRWKPVDSKLFELKANVWLSDLEQRNPPRNAYGTQPPTLGLPVGYRTGADTIMYGGDVSNTSTFDSDQLGALSLSYGLSWLTEDTRPRAYADIIEGWLNVRDAKRDEASAFAKAAYTPWDWMTVNAGLRYSEYSMLDRKTWANAVEYLNKDPRREDSGFSPSIGVTLQPIDGVQLYANYSSSLRYPSLMEVSSAFTLIINPDLGPERANNWEIGANLHKDGVFTARDRGMIKLGYFNWNIENYISRQWSEYEPNRLGMRILNLDNAKFSGLEFSGHYEVAGFSADLAANYYLGIEYCSKGQPCDSKSLYSDYATNHVPPKYSIDLTVAQKLLKDRLTVGGRVSYVGPRAIGHGQITQTGMSSFISQIKWKPYTLVDAFAEYKITDQLKASVSVENITDKYYVDPLGLVNQPGPGRTVRMGLTAELGGGSDVTLPAINNLPSLAEAGEWRGLYMGIHGGMSLGRTKGTTTALDGTSDPVSITESVNLALRDNFFGGVQAGFNWQLRNRFVVGLEVDYSTSNLATLHEARATETSLNGLNVLQAATLYEIDWTSSLRGRLGYAFQNGLLLYGTGGYALASETARRSQFRSTSGNNRSPNGTATTFAFQEETKELRSGWILGAGTEYAIDNHWSIKSEYTYSHFGNHDFAFPLAKSGTGIPYTYQGVTNPGSFSIVNGRNASNSIDLHTLKAGLNYRF
ncbi:TonB-dependent receptor [Hyphomicrobium sp. D-2]|uniref:TonB-dependent receptor domain-containing protein n=1 Tax=Hyphomicrobium sp. D-2 TaxID=3041621 RepID=UPI0024577725|nr:TonB-dependent receptor [Hyphomicrobium sp. D-2]MDH4980669.1 TonB-dependent receptor [Hyphomicrobium sp. D-2]